ncbi:MAG: DUF1624 domain-containing protein [Anaerolineales bacterium]|nr:MAG: DUF1624 domain-containing protein [Anaerolineales bacterium]
MAVQLEADRSAKASQRGARVFPVDALRGLIMTLMAIDHANIFVAQKHSPGEYWGGSFPVYYDALAFLTRLVTHPCAPGFFLLMGVGMVLFARSRRAQGWSEGNILGHLWVRGALLVALQLLVVNRAWASSPGGWPPKVYIGVLFALGGSMILGSLLLRWRPTRLLLLTLVLFAGTELLHPDPSMWARIPISGVNRINLLLMRPGGDTRLWSNYPVLPWLELVTFGMVFGHWLLEDARRASDRAWKIGLALLVVFVAVRYVDGFGNIRPRAGNSWIDFLNVVKYPPSMVFTLLTTGVNLILLALLARATGIWQRLVQPLAVFGQVPLLFYLAHLFLYATLGALLTPDGTSLAAMYAVWFLGLVVLYPLCLWYGRLKQGQTARSILRFF